MALLQYLGREEQFKLREDMVDAYPYTNMVNRIVKHKLDPFIVDTPVETIDQLKKFPYKGQSFEEICLERALWFKEQPQHKYIMWSGGIDSTMVVISFLKTHDYKDLENVSILASSESINEFPEFWNDIVLIFKNRILSSHFHVETYLKKGIVITGEFGDQIMGSDVINTINHRYGEEAIFMPWQAVMPALYNDLFGPNTMIEKYAPLIDHSLYPITTAYDWCWWFNFTNKWNMVKYRLLQKHGWKDPKNTFKNLHHFFDTIDFQLWSMHNPQYKVGNTHNSYKFLPKNIIVNFTGYTDYLNKPKIGSLYRIWSVKGLNIAVDTEFNFLNMEQTAEYINK